MRSAKSLGFRIVLLLAGLSFFISPASAYDVTDGIRFGAFSIHPSILTAVRYVDNIYFLPNDYVPEDRYAVPQNLESDFVINVTPSILFDVTIPTLTVQAGYKFFNDNHLGYDDPGKNHHKLNASNHTFSGLIDYQAPFGLIVRVRDAYTNQEEFEESEDFVDFIQGEQMHNDARGTLGFVHGPENNLFISYTYVNIIDEYVTAKEFDKMNQMHQGEIRLKFFPRTAVVAKGGYGIVDYERIQAFDSTNYWGMGGLKGQITAHLLLTLLGGYSMYDYQEGDDGLGPLAEAELGLVFPSATKLALGYRRKLVDAVNTNFYTSDEGYLTFTRLWGNRLTTTVFGSYQYNEFSEPFDRHEDFIQAKLDITMRLIFWLYTGAGYQLEHKIFDDALDRDITTRNIVLFKLIAQF